MTVSKKPVKPEPKKPISIIPNGKKIESRKPEFVKLEPELEIKPKPGPIIKVRRPVGRPVGTGKPEPDSPEAKLLDDEIKANKLKALKFLINGAFNLISLKGGDHWKLNQDELITLSQNTNDVLDLYGIDIGKGSPILMLVGSFIVIVTPRVIKSKNISKTVKSNAVQSVVGLVEQTKSAEQPKPTGRVLTNAERLSGTKL